MKTFLRIILASLFALFFSFSSNAQNTITTDSILQLSTCAGGNVLVPFTTAGSFPAGTVYTAQLSNAFGQFANPTNIGSSPINIGFIFATIPASANFGFLYKIRVVTATVIGTPCPNTLIVTQLAQLNQIIATPNDTICFGDSVTLSALVPGGTYSWSTGATSQAITVTQPGLYSVTVIDALQCETDTSINITVLPQPCLLTTEENEAFVFDMSPNPTAGKFQIQTPNAVSATTLISVLNSLGQEILLEKQLINPNTVEIDISSAEKGVYFLRITDGNRFTTKKIVKNQ